MKNFNEQVDSLLIDGYNKNNDDFLFAFSIDGKFILKPLKIITDTEINRLKKGYLIDKSFYHLYLYILGEEIIKRRCKKLLKIKERINGKLH